MNKALAAPETPKCKQHHRIQPTKGRCLSHQNSKVVYDMFGIGRMKAGHDSKHDRGPRGPRLHEVGADEQRDIACVTFASSNCVTPKHHQYSHPEIRTYDI